MNDISYVFGLLLILILLVGMILGHKGTRTIDNDELYDLIGDLKYFKKNLNLDYVKEYEDIIKRFEKL